MAEPSTILSEALTRVNEATFKALRAYEQRSRKGAGEKERELEDIAIERDEAVDDAARLRKQQSALMKESEQLKAELERMDLAHSHQTQLVDDLRDETRQWKQEAEQWKQQCLRIEESSRQQVADWKDRYLRADQEKARAEAEFTRVQALWEKALEGQASDPFQSSHRPAVNAGITFSASARNAVFATRHSTEKPAVSPLLPTPSTHASAQDPTPGPSHTVIRRVSTTFTLDHGVKSEEDSDNDMLTPPSPTANRPRKSGASGSSSRTRGRRARDDEDDDDAHNISPLKVRPSTSKAQPRGRNALSPIPPLSEIIDEYDEDDLQHTAKSSASTSKPRAPRNTNHLAPIPPSTKRATNKDKDELSPIKAKPSAARIKYTASRPNNFSRELRSASSDEEMDEDDDELDMVSDEGGASASRGIRARPRAPRRAAESAPSRKRKLPPDASATPAATPGRAKKQR
ncbi:hypothetical protein PENSPDRAFT_760479 [Peniophora sp. CONT]|nr:hypothetical protein PENSPDRAFT_760479 [Peniophora sp. CONT]